jgi:hypothetical protein
MWNVRFVDQNACDEAWLTEGSLDMIRIGLCPIPYRTNLTCEADHIICCDFLMAYADFIVPIQVCNYPVPTIQLSDEDYQKSKEQWLSETQGIWLFLSRGLQLLQWSSALHLLLNGMFTTVHTRTQYCSPSWDYDPCLLLSTKGPSTAPLLGLRALFTTVHTRTQYCSLFRGYESCLLLSTKGPSTARPPETTIPVYYCPQKDPVLLTFPRLRVLFITVDKRTQYCSPPGTTIPVYYCPQKDPVLLPSWDYEPCLLLSTQGPSTAHSPEATSPVYYCPQKDPVLLTLPRLRVLFTTVNTRTQYFSPPKTRSPAYYCQQQQQQ